MFYPKFSLKCTGIFIQTSVYGCRVDLEIKETLHLNSSISRLALKQESRKNWSNCPESYSNGGINLTQKGIEIFYNVNKKNLSRT